MVLLSTFLLPSSNKQSREGEKEKEGKKNKGEKKIEVGTKL